MFDDEIKVSPEARPRSSSRDLFLSSPSKDERCIIEESPPRTSSASAPCITHLDELVEAIKSKSEAEKRTTRRCGNRVPLEKQRYSPEPALPVKPRVRTPQSTKARRKPPVTKTQHDEVVSDSIEAKTEPIVAIPEPVPLIEEPVPETKEVVNEVQVPNAMPRPPEVVAVNFVESFIVHEEVNVHTMNPRKFQSVTPKKPELDAGPAQFYPPPAYPPVHQNRASINGWRPPLPSLQYFNNNHVPLVTQPRTRFAPPPNFPPVTGSNAVPLKNVEVVSPKTRSESRPPTARSPTQEREVVHVPATTPEYVDTSVPPPTLPKPSKKAPPVIPKLSDRIILPRVAESVRRSSRKIPGPVGTTTSAPQSENVNPAPKAIPEAVTKIPSVRRAPLLPFPDPVRRIAHQPKVTAPSPMPVAAKSRILAPVPQKSADRTPLLPAPESVWMPLISEPINVAVSSVIPEPAKTTAPPPIPVVAKTPILAPVPQKSAADRTPLLQVPEAANSHVPTNFEQVNVAAPPVIPDLAQEIVPAVSTPTNSSDVPLMTRAWRRFPPPESVEIPSRSRGRTPVPTTARRRTPAPTSPPRRSSRETRSKTAAPDSRRCGTHEGGNDASDTAHLLRIRKRSVEPVSFFTMKDEPRSPTAADRPVIPDFMDRGRSRQRSPVSAPGDRPVLLDQVLESPAAKRPRRQAERAPILCDPHVMVHKTNGRPKGARNLPRSRSSTSLRVSHRLAKAAADSDPQSQEIIIPNGRQSFTRKTKQKRAGDRFPSVTSLLTCLYQPKWNEGDPRVPDIFSKEVLERGFSQSIVDKIMDNVLYEETPNDS